MKFTFRFTNKRDDFFESIQFNLFLIQIRFQIIKVKDHFALLDLKQKHWIDVFVVCDLIQFRKLSKSSLCTDILSSRAQKHNLFLLFRQ